MTALKLGKQPATVDERDLLFSTYAIQPQLPVPPEQFGHETLIPATGWGMLGNDQWGDCAWAGPAHETMLLTAEANDEVAFTTEGVLSDYAAATGFDINAGPSGQNPTDQGSNVRQVLGYRRTVGIIDAAGSRHMIGAYLKLDHTNLQQVFEALFVFQVVGLGLQFPDSAMDQFKNGQPWDVVPGAKIEGGHYVCLVAKRDNLDVVTWGALQQMTVAFFQTYCDEAWAYVSADALANGLDVDGFNLQQLQADLAALRQSSSN